VIMSALRAVEKVNGEPLRAWIKDGRLLVIR
jgi:hypothetical protein